MNRVASKLYEHIINPPADDALTRAAELAGKSLPTIWLLGKTGAGKTSIVQHLTGNTRAEIGNGYRPCTKTSSFYDYPEEFPIVRFLDTRGLGEAGYDARDDLRELGDCSHALFVVVRLKDAEQSAVVRALSEIHRHAKHIRPAHLAVIHTGALEIPDAHDRQRAVASTQSLVEQAWGSPVDHCVVDFGETGTGQLNELGAEELANLISTKVPALRIWLQKHDHADAEQRNYQRLQTEVLWYASVAAASDAIPLVGLVTVPAIQGKLLHSLAQKYGIAWNRRNVSEFVSALGTLFTLRYAVSLGGRQLVKLIPGYGQLFGSAFAATISYASTYALGRAACSYLYHRKSNIPLGRDAVRAAYQQALREGQEAGRAEHERTHE
jgi:uncharacterized protein (DUF697 family)